MKRKSALATWIQHITHLSIAQLWGLTLLAGIFIFLNTHPIRPHDFWWHVRAGQEIVTTGHIPVYDTYSSTVRGTPYNYTVYWLAEVVMYHVYTLGGPALSVFLHSVLITAGYALLLWQCRLQSGYWRIGALCVFVAAALGINSWNVRPQTITFLLGPVYLCTMALYTRRPRPALLAVFPLGMLVWVNSHGSFPLGILLVGIWLVDGWTMRRKTPRPLWPDALVALVSTALASLLNPQGVGMVRYLVGMGQNPAVQKLVPEWAAPTFHGVDGATFYVVLALGGLLLFFSRRNLRLSHVLTLAAFGALSLRTSRGIPWFGITLAPIVADLLPPPAGKKRIAPGRKPANDDQPAHQSDLPGAVSRVCGGDLAVVQILSCTAGEKSGADLRRDAHPGHGIFVGIRLSYAHLQRSGLWQLPDLGSTTGLPGLRGPTYRSLSAGSVAGLHPHLCRRAGLG
ncbi:MAG TPA: hypothetical protein PLH19_06230 [Anaerolineae bacterium]|nr:hypothetical protein [Anaerolineae bacterium]HQH38118.1 hypothetical protein [Anaerolineae bacterium]